LRRTRYCYKKHIGRLPRARHTRANKYKHFLLEISGVFMGWIFKKLDGKFIKDAETAGVDIKKSNPRIVWFSVKPKLLHLIKSDVLTDLVTNYARRGLYENF